MRWSGLLQRTRMILRTCLIMRLLIFPVLKPLINTRMSILSKSAIRQAEAKGKKTITLTVNRMLTGSTVPEWDTMLYLKDTSSPQEYDQATFRLQNQFVDKYYSEDGDFVKFDKNHKPF